MKNVSLFSNVAIGSFEKSLTVKLDKQTAEDTNKKAADFSLNWNNVYSDTISVFNTINNFNSQ